MSTPCNQHCASDCDARNQDLATGALRVMSANADLRRENGALADGIVTATSQKVVAHHLLQVQEILTHANLRTADAERAALVAEIKGLAHKFVAANDAAKGFEDALKLKERDVLSLKARVSLLESQRGQALQHTDRLAADLDEAQVKIEKLEAKLAKNKKQLRGIKKADRGIDVAGA